MKRCYYIFKSGELRRKDNSIVFNTEDDMVSPIPVEDVDCFFVFGEVTINSKLINFLAQKGISVHFFNYYGFYSGSFYPKEQLNSGMLFVEQVKHYTEHTKRTFIAKEILKAGSYNIYRNLRYYNERGKDLCMEMEKIEKFRVLLEAQPDIPSIMGIEGNIREVYYSSFNKIIDQEINFEKRVKHPPDNMINSMISFVNSLVYTTVLGEIYHTQLTPLVSFLHEPGQRRFSLSLDIAEIFKPIIGDRMIFSMLNKKQITESDFEKDLNFIYLKEKARKAILQEYDDRLKQTIKHKKLGKDVSYRYLIRLEMYKLVKHILGEQQYEGFKIWW